METIKWIFIGLTIFLLSNQLLAQEANYNKLSDAFKVSYEKEALGEYEKAIEALKNVYSNDSYETNLRIGWLHYSQGQHLESKKYYQKAIELKPFAIEPKFGLIYPVYAMGNMEEVIQLYNEIITIAPNNTQALYNLGSIYFYQQQYEKAEKLISKVVNLFPFEYEGLILLAHTNFHLKKYREAKVLYHKVLLYNPEDQIAIESLKLLE